MKLVKCPRCDLNYIREDEKYCKVCLREIKGDSQQEEVELCSICNENPTLPGKDVCLFCLKEMNGEKNVDPDDNNGDSVGPASIGDIDSVSTMDEIIPEMEDDEEIPSQEYGEIENELSLEDVRDEEEMNEKEDDEESEEEF